MNKNFLTLIAVGLLCVGQTACSSGGGNVLQFKTYEARSGEAVVTIDIPQGEDELQQNISKGIFDIMAHSAIAKEAGSAKDGSLNEVADDYSKRMAKLLESGDYGPATADLTIEVSYLNEASATFHVYDGVYVNGEPDVYDRIVRLSDAHVMEQSELVDISNEDLQSLIDKNLKEEVPVYLEDGYWILPAGVDSCRVVWLISRAASGEVMIPISEMERFLKPDAKALFTAKPIEFTRLSEEETESNEKSAENTDGDDNENVSENAIIPVDVSTADPVELTKTILNRFIEGNYDIADFVINDSRKMIVPLLKQLVTERGGLKEYKITNFKINGDKAKVYISTTYKRKSEDEVYMYEKTAEGWRLANGM